jgi:hypothetical protein
MDAKGLDMIVDNTKRLENELKNGKPDFDRYLESIDTIQIVWTYGGRAKGSIYRASIVTQEEFINPV